MFLRRAIFLFTTLSVILVGSALLVFPLTGCTTKGANAGANASESFLQNPDAESRDNNFQILAQYGQTEGMRFQDIPVWLATYIRSGTFGLEALPDYNENYAFIIENRGTTLQEIRTWVAACNPMKALAFQISRRIQGRLAEVARVAVPRNGTPLMDAAAEFVTATGEAFYGGAHEINRWWIQTKNTEYRGYIFLIMDQEMLDRQLHRLMVDTDFTLTQEERAIWTNTRF